jgi:tetratricopeptide (TPR) repeat protein
MRSKIDLSSLLTGTFLAFTILTATHLQAQSPIPNSQPANPPIPAFDQGLQLENNFDVEGALRQYEVVLAEQPNHVQALTHASRMLTNIGGRLSLDHKAEKKKYYEQAKTYALSALRLDPQVVDTHLAYVVALGLLTEVAGSASERVRDAKVIKTEAETIIKLDSTFGAGYFVLGKWHLEVSKLNWMEKLACDLFFGGLPEASVSTAIACLKKASQLEPNTILYLYGEASAYEYEGDKTTAIALLKKAIALPPKEPDDLQRKQRCEELLKEILD